MAGKLGKLGKLSGLQWLRGHVIMYGTIKTDLRLAREEDAIALVRRPLLPLLPHGILEMDLAPYVGEAPKVQHHGSRLQRKRTKGGHTNGEAF